MTNQDTREVVGTFEVNGKVHELAVIGWVASATGKRMWTADDGMSHRDYAGRIHAVKHLKRTHGDASLNVQWKE
jgi:hypothetical protein